MTSKNATECLQANAEGIARAVQILESGELVAVPTETVYGLAARADSPEAIAKIYAAKGRPEFNPLIVHGQTHGGIVQGAGQALFEHCYVDTPSGQPLAGSLMDYGISRANDFPSFRTEIAEVLSPTNPLGIKAGGEGGTTPALAVIVNAAVDALQDYDIEDIPMPLSPHAIWTAIQTASSNPRP